MSAKISLATYEQWLTLPRTKGWRLGQEFINKFFSNITDPLLYYECNDDNCKEIILARYVGEDDSMPKVVYVVMNSQQKPRLWHEDENVAKQYCDELTERSKKTFKTDMPHLTEKQIEESFRPYFVIPLSRI